MKTRPKKDAWQNVTGLLMVSIFFAESDQFLNLERRLAWWWWVIIQIMKDGFLNLFSKNVSFYYTVIAPNRHTSSLICTINISVHHCLNPDRWQAQKCRTHLFLWCKYIQHGKFSATASHQWERHEEDVYSSTLSTLCPWCKSNRNE